MISSIRSTLQYVRGQWIVTWYHYDYVTCSRFNTASRDELISRFLLSLRELANHGMKIWIHVFIAENKKRKRKGPDQDGISRGPRVSDGIKKKKSNITSLSARVSRDESKRLWKRRKQWTFLTRTVYSPIDDGIYHHANADNVWTRSTIGYVLLTGHSTYLRCIPFGLLPNVCIPNIMKTFVYRIRTLGWSKKTKFKNSKWVPLYFLKWW